MLKKERSRPDLWTIEGLDIVRKIRGGRWVPVPTSRKSMAHWGETVSPGFERRMNGKGLGHHKTPSVQDIKMGRSESRNKIVEEENGNCLRSR